MSEKTNISWTDSTFNPWIGCTKVSAGCDHCYAETLMDTRLKTVNWGHGQPRKRTSENYWKQPFNWNAKAKKEGRRHKVFCASLADVFDTEVPIEWLRDLLDLIRSTPYLDWQLLTKRPGAFVQRLGAVIQLLDNEPHFKRWIYDWICVDKREPRNVWIGTSIEDQAAADVRIPALIKVPAVVRFLSCEPLIGSVELFHTGALGDLCGCSYYDSNPCAYCQNNGTSSPPFIHWVIVGGESGPNCRTMDSQDVYSIKRECDNFEIPFFFKQWGGTTVEKGGNLLNDKEYHAFPQV